MSALPFRTAPKCFCCSHPTHPLLTVPYSFLPSKHSELHGESGTQTTLTRKTFEQTIKHSLAKTHGVVGGAIVMEHVVPFTNENEDDDFDGCSGRQSNGTIGTELVMTDTHSTSKSTSKAGHGIIKLHVSDFQTLATSLTLLSETSESVSCGARVVSKGTDLVALGFDGRGLRKNVVREALGQPHEP